MSIVLGMKGIAVRKAQAQFSALCNSPDRVLITRHGKPVAAIVGPTDARLLAQLDKLGLLDELLAKYLESQ